MSSFFVLRPTIDESVIVVPINANETQSFMINGQVPVISKIKNPWRQAQINLVNKALLSATHRHIDIPLILIPGVSHFGHLCGDQLGIIIAVAKQLAAESLEHKILIPNPPDSIVDILAFLGVAEQIIYLSTPHPQVIHLNPRSYMATLKEDAASALHAGMALAHLAICTALTRYEQSMNIAFRSETDVFLTSGRPERISNIKYLNSQLSMNGWKILKPGQLGTIEALMQIRHARRLIAENGSILFNIFLSRTSNYQVLTSPRVSESRPDWFHGGYIYNKFHDGILNYLVCDLVEPSSKHPYTDSIYVGSDLIETILEG